MIEALQQPNGTETRAEFGATKRNIFKSLIMAREDLGIVPPSLRPEYSLNFFNQIDAAVRRAKKEAGELWQTPSPLNKEMVFDAGQTVAILDELKNATSRIHKDTRRYFRGHGFTPEVIERAEAILFKQ